MPKKERFKIFIAVYLFLINKSGEILFLKRANTGYQDGKFGLIQGHLDGDESAKQGIIREAKEEAGIILKYEDLEAVNFMHLRFDLEYIDIFFKADKWEGEIINGEPNKCVELKWFPLDALPENIVPEVAIAIENFKKKVFYDEVGWGNLSNKN